MKKLGISLLLVVIMIMSISAVNAVDEDVSDDLVMSQTDSDVLEIDSVDEDVSQAADEVEILSAGTSKNFTVLQNEIDASTGTMFLTSNYERVDGESDVSITKDLNIIGSNNPKIDAKNLGGIFNVQSGHSLTLMGVTLVNGNSENGGAIYNDGGSVSILNSKLLNNTATKSGGAIYNNAGTLIVSGSTLDGNDLTDRSVNGYGGAAVYDESGTVIITNSEITNNLKNIVHRGGTGSYTGDLSSAAVTTKHGSLTVSDSYFAKNSGSYGGAILAQGADAVLTVEKTTFEDNFAFNGGAIDVVDDAKYTITNSTFKGNNVKGTGSTNSNYANGGAICAAESRDDCLISGCTFEDNTAAIGGAISCSNAHIENCVFTNNLASASNSENFNGRVNNRGGFGGAIYNDNTITIEGSSFTDNIGRGRGLDLKIAEISDSSFDNTIISINNRGTVYVDNNTYKNNPEKDISSTTNCKVYIGEEGQIPKVTGGDLYYGPTCFADLQALIDSGSTATMHLTSDFAKLDSEYETFANGVSIDRSVSINGDGHTITSDNGKVFNVESTGYLGLSNAEIVGDGTAAIVNDGTVSLGLANPATFTNVGEYAIENNGRVSQSSLTAFTQLDNLIGLVNGGEVYIGSSKITKADDEKEAFADGIVIDKDLTITGYESYKTVSGTRVYYLATYINANDDGRIFNVGNDATLTLTKVNLTNGNADLGGAVHVDEGAGLVANNVNFISNTATTKGGAIYSEGTVNLNNVNIKGNKISKKDGVISDDNGGAAIYNKAGTVTLNDTNVVSNQADYVQGDIMNGVIVVMGTTTINNSYIADNHGRWGGAITVTETGEALTVENTTFEENTAIFGGAIFQDTGSVAVNDCKFYNNSGVGVGSAGTSSTQGGAILVMGSDVATNIKGSEFINNTADVGGAVSISSGTTGTFAIDDCTFTENKANDYGGAVYEYTGGSTVAISNSDFNKNTAQAGGAIFVASESDLDVDDCTFTENEATLGGGAIYTQSDASVSGSTFTDNVGPGFTNALYTQVAGTELEWTNNVVTGNDGKAQVRTGNGVIVTSPLKITILNNETVNIHMAPYTVTAIVKDDMDNNIIDLGFRFVIDGDVVQGISINATSGKYSATFTPTEPGTFVVSTNLPDEGNVLTGTLVISRSLTDLATLVANAEAGDTIKLDGDYAYIPEFDEAIVNGIVIDKDITIDGNGSDITGSNLARLFNVTNGATLTLNNVTIRDSKADKGAGVYVNEGATLKADYVTFSNNTATYRGGAIYSEGTVNIDNSVFDKNDITYRARNDDNGGAAVYNLKGTLTIAHSNITNSVKDIVIRNGNAGDLLNGVIVTSGETLITDSYFANNTGSWGGAISSVGYMNDDDYTLTVKNTVFEGNNATFGGAIFVESSALIVDNCTFENNLGVGVGSSGTSNTQGGAILVHNPGSSAEITDSTFTGNSANIGGAVSLAGVYADSLIENCTFTDNTATSEGGAVYLGTANDAVITVKDSRFSGNTAPWGNAISNDGALSLSNNTVSTTSADIANYYGTIISEVNVIILNNETVDFNGEILITAKVTDDNENLIKDINFDFDINGTEVHAAFDSDSGLYQGTYVNEVPGVYVVNMNYPDETNLIVKTATLRSIKGTYTDLQNQINSADGTLDLTYDFAYNELIDGANFPNGVVIADSIAINGNGYTISGSNNAALFNVSTGATLTLNNVTVRDTKADKGAGAYVSEGATLDATNVNFINNTATTKGGAIYSEGTVNLNHATIKDNKISKKDGVMADDNGGAAIYNKAGTVTLNDTKVIDNQADYVQGDIMDGVIVVMGTTTINNSYIANNHGRWGGAITVTETGEALTVENTTFEENTAIFGGAIFQDTGSVAVNDCKFYNNSGVGVGSAGTSSTQGGAILVMGSDVATNIKGSEFINNTADVGGAVSISSGTTGTFAIDDCTFTENKANDYGGAVYEYTGGSDIAISNSDFNKNTAVVGGAIFVSPEGGVDIDDCTFTDNTASSEGGALYLWTEDGAVATVKDSRFSGNTAPWGNAISNDGALSLSNNTVSTTSADIANYYGVIISPIYVEVMENKTYSYHMSDVTLTAVVTDDNGNLIKDINFDFTIGDEDTVYARYSDGIYSATYTPTVPGTYVVNMSYPSDNLVVKTATLKFARSLIDLANIISETNAGDTIVLDGDYAYIAEFDEGLEDGIVIDKDITIDGKGFAICGNDSARLFNVAGGTLTLNNVTICDGAADDGAAVKVGSGAKLVANDAIFKDNVAENNGGAIYTDGGEIDLTNCVLDNNDVTEITTNDNSGGAAIYAKNAQVTLTNTNVTNNGKRELDRTNNDLVNAVINLLDSSATITGGLFENNTGIYGGAINADGDGTQTLTVTGATFNNNKAYNGAAINLHDMKTTIDDSTFTNNLVVGPGSPGYYAMGGAIVVDGIGSLDVSDSTFIANSATGTNASAGAIGISTVEDDFTATIDNCTFEQNTAVLKGGAVFANAVDVTISDSTFSDDNEAGNGNAIYNGGNLKLSNNTVNSDSAEIFTAGKINTDERVIVTVNGVQNVDAVFYDSIPVVLKITDDNGNLIDIQDSSMTIDLPVGVMYRTTLYRNEETGFFEGDVIVKKSGLLTPDRLAFLKYFNSYNANTHLNSTYVNMIKANATLNTTYENITYPGDVVITFNLTGKEGAPAVACPASRFVVTINDVEYKVKITDGIGTLTVSDLPMGNYTIDVAWTGHQGSDLGYNPITASYPLEVSAKKGTYTDLRYQIDHAENGVLDLPYDFAYDETYDGANFVDGILISESIAINGNGHEISGCSTAALFNVATDVTLNLNNVTIRDTKADKGAAVYVNEGATLKADHVTFSNNTATCRGGAIYSEGTVDVDNSVFDKNDITYRAKNEDNGGAAIYNLGGTLTIAHSNITNSVKDIVIRNGNAGDLLNGVIVTSGDTLITDSYFANNTGSYGGAITSCGGLNSEDYTLTVKNTVFEGNNATFGGAIFVESSELIVDNCTFENNKGVGVGSPGTSYTQGGAIVVFPNGAKATITDSTFTGNSADLGGAVSLPGVDQDSLIENCTFTDNTASADGGAIYLWTSGSAAVTVADSTFSGNTADRGNAILTDGVLKLSNNTISKTRADVEINYGIIDSFINATFLGNQTIPAHLGDKVVLNATLTDDNGNTIYDPYFRFAVNGETISDIDFDEDTGLFTYEYAIESAGEKVISTNYNYGGIEKFIGILDIPKANATLYVTTGQNDRFPYGKNVTVFIGLYDEYSGVGLNETVNVIINNTAVPVTIADGEGSFNMSGFEPGKYSALGIFAGNDNYNGPVYDSTVFEVLYPDRTLSIEVDDIKYGEVAIINITVKDADGSETSGMVVLNVNGTEYSVRVDGKESVEISGLDVNEAGYVVNATLLEEGLNAAVVNDTESFTVGINTLSFTIEATQDATYPDDVTITVTSDVDGTAHVTVVTNNGYENEFDITIEDGVGTYALSGLVPDEYEATAIYALNGYEQKEDHATFEVVKGTPNVTAETNPVTYPENATILFTTDVAGTVEVTVESGKTLDYSVDVGGNVIVLPVLSPGEYPAAIKFKPSDDGYNDVEINDNVVVVNAATPEFAVEFSEATYPEDVVVTITGTDGVYTVVVGDNEATVTVTVIDGTGSENITGLTAGAKVANITFAAENYTTTSAEATFNVLKAAATIEPEVTGDLVVDGTATVTFALPKDIDGTVTVTVDGTNLEFTSDSGVYTVTINNLTIGGHTVVAQLAGDTNYEDATGSITFDVGKANPTIAPVVEAGNYGDVTNITVNINPDATQYILISIDGNNVGFDEIDGGVVEVAIADLSAGEHNLTVTYTGDTNYNKGTANATFTIGKAASIVVIDSIVKTDSTFDIVVDYSVVNETDIAIVVKNQDGTEISSGIDTSVAGKVTISNLDVGNYTITISNEENDNYNGSSATANFSVDNVITILSAGDITMSYKDGTAWTATLTDTENNPISGVVVKIGISGKSYNIKTDANGVASLPINLYPGIYEINATYVGDKYRTASFASGVLNVTKAIAVLSTSNINMTFKDGTAWAVTLTEANGNPISGVSVNMTIAGKVYFALTDANGVASLPINLYPGNYSVTASFANSRFEAAPVDVMIIVNKAIPVLTGQDIISDYGSVTVYNVTLTDADGKAIVDGYVNFIIDNKTYKRKTDENGVASLSLTNLDGGNHVVIARSIANYMFGEAETQNTIVVNKPDLYITADDVNMTYKDGSSYDVQLVDSNGIPMNFANEIVKITIVGKTYNIKTNSNGIASLPVNLRSGTYQVQAEYNGNVITNVIVVNNA